jgi:hypothetical protein|tara:strand:+ start:2302 stop:3429 length:1128 start_codon:yes stop_codon:yes gene_type:complete
MSNGIVVLAQNTYQNIDLKLQYEGITADVWYEEVEYLAGQHVWYKNNIYKAPKNVSKNTKFSEDKFELTINNVKLYSDKNKYLEYKELFTGDLVLADNRIYLVNYDGKINYVEQACVLAMSLKVLNPDTKISIITNDSVPKDYQKLFDQIIPIPFGDSAIDSDWKIENRWKLYHASPYDETIVMDTDMLVLQDISSWWNFLANYKIFFPNRVYTYRGTEADTSYYRKVFKVNNLPNLFSGLHYFKKSDEAQEFYHWLELVVTNWEEFYELFLKGVTRPTHMSIDVCASIVALILNCTDKITNSNVSFPSFTHMKKNCQDWVDGAETWQDRVGFYISRDCKIKIGNYNQTGILHYTENNFLEKSPVLERYRNLINV